MAITSKPHIGIFGRRNSGKSSLINFLAGQDISIVSHIAGTTTDPVKKTMEIHGLGPVVIIDTAGIDDSGEIGEKRVKKTLQTISKVDLAIIVLFDNQFDEIEENIIDQLQNYEVPFFIVHNKSDLAPLNSKLMLTIKEKYVVDIIDFSVKEANNTDKIVDLIKKNAPKGVWKSISLVGDLISYGDIVLLITPIDNEAPEGRLILPQVQTIRDILDNECVVIVAKEREVDAFLKKTGIKPKLVITDSSIFLKADAMIPKEIPLTGFSILLARYRGPFEAYLQGTPKLAQLKDGDNILLLESCTHQTSCDDIGRVKIPRWLNQFSGKKLEYEVVSGLASLPRKITEYAMVIQCGGCMITQKQIHSRLRPAIEAGVPVTNYGMAIAFMQGIYNRAIEPFVKQDKDLYL